jgi:drug/metabolite transporter (DMT)-like permease
MNKHRLRAYGLYIIVSIIWAIASPVIKFTLGGLDPLNFLTYRFGLSTFAGIIIFLIFGSHFPKSLKTWILVAIYSLITSSVTLGLLFWGLNDTTVTETSIISVVGPLITAAGGAIFLHDHITKTEKVGMGVAILGMLLTIVGPLADGGKAFSSFTGNLLILAYLLTNAVSVVLLKILLRHNIRPMFLTNATYTFGFLSLLPFFLANSSHNVNAILTLPTKYHLGVIYMALLSGTLAYFLGNVAQKSVEVSEAAVFSYLYPILSIPIAVIWLKETITPIYIVGAAVIFTGVVIAEYKKRKS